VTPERIVEARYEADAHDHLLADYLTEALDALLAERKKITRLMAALPSCFVCLKPLLPGNAELGNPVTGARIHAGCETGLRT